MPTKNNIEHAVDLHKQGKLDEAEAIYRSILSNEPENPDALHLLGNLYYLKGQAEEGLIWVEKSVLLDPQFPNSRHTLGLIHQVLGNWDSAIEAHLKVLELDPNYHASVRALGQIHNQLGDSAKALSYYETLVVNCPENVDYQMEYGGCLQNLKQIEKAEQIYLNLLTSHPEHIGCLNNLGVLYLNQDNPAKAETILLKLVQVAPDYAFGLNNLALAYQNLERPDLAESYYKKAIKADPAYLDANMNLGRLYDLLDRDHEAIAIFEKIIQAHPKHHVTYNALGGLFMKREDYKKAEAHFLTTLKHAPQNEDYTAFSNLAIIYRKEQELDKAEAMARNSIKACPELSEPHNTLGWVLHDNDRHEEAEQAFREGLAKDPKDLQIHSNLLLHLTYRMQLSHEDLFNEHRQFSLNNEPSKDALAKLPAPNNKRFPYRKLRIAYVSPDYRRHVVRNFIQPIIEHHNRNQVEVFCYAQVEEADDVTEIIKGLCDHWRVINDLNDLDLACQIRRDEIDVLVDLAGHCAHNRLGTFLYKPAPVQVAYLGYIATTGLDAIDYRITDPIMNPPNSPEQTSEALYHLDRCYKVYQAAPNEPDVKPEVSPAGAITFGSLHRISKLSQQTVHLWSKLLHALPSSKLLLARHELIYKDNQERIFEKFSNEKISRDRLILDNTIGYKTHMEIYHKIDIGLDPIPVVGGATTAESLWMGVPVLTLQGEAFRERISSTLLNAVGLDEWICNNEDEYVRKAIRFANDYDYRLQLRSNMRRLFLESPLSDYKDLARSLEHAYIDMWQRYLAKSS